MGEVKRDAALAENADSGSDTAASPSEVLTLDDEAAAPTAPNYRRKADRQLQTIMRRRPFVLRMRQQTIAFRGSTSIALV